MDTNRIKRGADVGRLSCRDFQHRLRLVFNRMRLSLTGHKLVKLNPPFTQGNYYIAFVSRLVLN
jgi:hypothetical protein